MEISDVRDVDMIPHDYKHTQHLVRNIQHRRSMGGGCGAMTFGVVSVIINYKQVDYRVIAPIAVQEWEEQMMGVPDDFPKINYL